MDHSRREIVVPLSIPDKIQDFWYLQHVNWAFSIFLHDSKTPQSAEEIVTYVTGVKGVTYVTQKSSKSNHLRINNYSNIQKTESPSYHSNLRWKQIFDNESLT